MRHSHRHLFHALILGFSITLAGAGVAALAAQSRPQPESSPNGFDPEILIRGLSATPGNLGVEVAQFQSGKLSIFAWFEDKSAALRWHAHPVHRGAAMAFFGAEGAAMFEDRTPMAHITDEDGPILVIATITPHRGEAPGGAPIAQISIEHYQPMPGGLAIGGRLTPQAVDVPHMLISPTFPGAP